MRRVLWIFAHQDDEVAAAARILASRRRGEEVWCAYLTGGRAAHVRNAESIAALKTLGVTDAVFFAHPDGALHRHLDEAIRDVESIDAEFDEVGTLAWEGGHQDHDAAHLVALAFARKRGLEVYEVPLYNGFGVPGPFFRVMHPVGDGWERTKLTFDDALRIVGLTRFYRSQRKTWLGLLPEALLRLLVLRRTYARRADASRTASAPHAPPSNPILVVLIAGRLRS